MKLIVGIGNPGRRYARSRHNLGWMIVDALAERFGFGRARGRFEGRCADGRIDGVPVALLKPTTYVNESGRSVVTAVAWYRVALEDVLVCVDDIHLPTGQLRVRRQGSSGGHGGLSSIAERLGSDAFARLRVGIGRPEMGGQVGYVLGRFSKEELPAVETAVGRAADAAATWATQGVEVCMNAFNEG